MARPSKRSLAMKKSWARRNGAVALVEDPRNKTHGDFAKNAQVSQDIKTVLRAAGYLTLTAAQTEALDQIALKISRIVSGKAKYTEHWKDVGGYAYLGEQACQGDDE